MGQGLDVMQTCHGHGQASPKSRRDTVGLDYDLNSNKQFTGGHGGDNVLSNRDLSQKKHQETVKKAREWQRSIRTENRQLERDIERIRREEAKLKREIQSMASKGQLQSVHMLAKQVVKARNSVAHLERTKCSMNALQLHLSTAISTASSAGALKMSSDMMKEMNAVMNVPEMQRTMEEMRAEMSRAEMVDEMMEEAFDESEHEDEVDAEVQKIYDELALDTSALLQSAHLTTASVPAPAASIPLPRTGVAPQAVGHGSDPLMQRLQALRT